MAFGDGSLLSRQMLDGGQQFGTQQFSPAMGMPQLPSTLMPQQTTGQGLAPAPQPLGAPQQPGAPASVNALSPNDALHNFANSAGMQFQLEQGANSLNNLYAARGQIQSGAAAKALQGYGQNTALQNYFMPYMGLLGGQQSVGAQAGSAIAGVGSNFGNTAAGINQNSANAIGQGAMNIGNANANGAAINGLANSNMFSTIGGQLGNVASSFIGSRGGGIPSPNLLAPMSTSFGTAAPLSSMQGFY